MTCNDALWGVIIPWTWQSTPHMGDWAHLAVKFTEGKIMAKSNPYHGKVWCYIRAIHLTHSREQQLRMISLLTFVMLEWEGMMLYDIEWCIILLYDMLWCWRCMRRYEWEWYMNEFICCAERICMRKFTTCIMCGTLWTLMINKWCCMMLNAYVWVRVPYVLFMRHYDY